MGDTRSDVVYSGSIRVRRRGHPITAVDAGNTCFKEAVHRPSIDVRIFKNMTYNLPVTLRIRGIMMRGAVEDHEAA